MKYSLKELRARNNLTQAEVAKLVGCNRQTYVYYENGSIKPTIHVALKIAEVLGVTAEEIKW